jgi:hypothetical protein
LLTLIGNGGLPVNDGGRLSFFAERGFFVDWVFSLITGNRIRGEELVSFSPRVAAECCRGGP